MPARPWDVSLPPASGPGHHPLAELSLVITASAQVGWHQDSPAVSMVGTHGGGRVESRHTEK